MLQTTEDTELTMPSDFRWHFFLVSAGYLPDTNNWIHDLVSTISTRGWNNVPDMTLSILYGKSSLKDMNQLITYQYEADRMNRQWYSVL